MSKRLYVGNLLLALTQQDLAEAFAPWGPVETTIIVTDHNTGMSRGFGFVDLPEEKIADAIAKMHGSQLRGRPLIVNEAKPREAGPRDTRSRESRTGGPSAGGAFRRGAEAASPVDTGEPTSRNHYGESPQTGPNDGHSGGSRERGDAPRGNPRFGEDRPPQGGRGNRERSERDRGRREGGGRKERAPKRSRMHDDDEPEW